MSLFNLYAPINDLGYGIVTRGIISGLRDIQKDDFHLNPIGAPQLDDKEEVAALQRNMSIGWQRSSPSVALWHEFDLTKFSGNKLIAFPIFETTDFFPQAKSYLSQMDAICVMSHWAKTIVERAVGTDVPVFVVPGAANVVDTPVIKNTKKSGAFTFLTVGKYEQRKSPLETIQAYLMAFHNKPYDTRLICHCFNHFDPNFSKNITAILQKFGLQITPGIHNSSIVAVGGNCIVEIPMGRLSRENLFQLYHHSHVGVFPAKAEGWNLPLIEAVVAGLPCIATNYSAHTEFLNSEMGYNKNLLIDKFKMDVAVDGVYFHGNRGDWAVVESQDIAEKMIYAYANYEEIIKNFDSSKIQKTFTWKNSATKLMEAIDSCR